jgi:xylan 1,4-beta-xylosidase
LSSLNKFKLKEKMNHIYLFTISLLVSYTLVAQKNINNKSETTERFINADFSVEKGRLNTMFKECVGAGRANEGLRADWQQQLA